MLRGVVLNLENRIKFNHNENLPNSFRMLIVGSSGAGKTSFLFQMLLESNFIDYNALYIFTTTPNQQEYELLNHGFSNGLSKEQIASIALNQDNFKGVPIPVLCKRNLNDVYNSVVGTIMDKNNFISMAENVWSKKYSYIAINKENDKIITELFDEQDSDCKNGCD